ncbi:transporter [Escherichia coli]|nr:transporter [Salmonella enterica]EBP3741957.1 transporter [Salmonella enterica subsp. enterica]EDL3159279.1 transporter [Salmonella enterica subsp. enterica serovar Typhimurium]EDP9544135.1 transporter [Salmonella enterica subsp. enterica serovar Saintpaul]EFO4208938.1 transporter [Escherichia coli]
MYNHEKKSIIELKINFQYENYIASLLFLMISWGLLYLWFYLLLSNDEKTHSTLPSSWLIRIFIMITALSLIFQKRPGALKYFIAITSGLIIIFIGIITVFHQFLNIPPDFYDFIFYYECFLLTLFCGFPICLFIRMI